jgi:hypothetical protein
VGRSALSFRRFLRAAGAQPFGDQRLPLHPAGLAGPTSTRQNSDGDRAYGAHWSTVPCG